MKYSLRFHEGGDDDPGITPTQDQGPEYTGIDPHTGQPFEPGTDIDAIGAV